MRVKAKIRTHQRSQNSQVLTSSAFSRRIDEAMTSESYDANFISDLFKKNRLATKRFAQELKV